MKNITLQQSEITDETIATIKRENNQLKQMIADKDREISALKRELKDDNSRIDYLFDIIAIQEQERSILEASIKGNESICNCNIIRPLNDNIFTVSQRAQ